MKKIVLSLVIMFAVIAANAQESKWFATGSFRLWHDNEAAETLFSVIPEVGYNFNEKWAVGLEVGYSHEGSYDELIFSPFARFTYYRNNLVSLFVDGNIGYCGDFDINGVEIGLKPGIALNLNKHFSLQAKFGFLGYRNDYEGKLSDGFGIDLNPANALSFGIHYEF